VLADHTLESLWCNQQLQAWNVFLFIFLLHVYTDLTSFVVLTCRIIMAAKFAKEEEVCWFLLSQIKLSLCTQYFTLYF